MAAFRIRNDRYSSVRANEVVRAHSGNRGSRTWSLFTAALILSTGIFLTIAQSGAISKEADEEWIFQYKHLNWGVHTLYICKNALKIVNKTYGFVVLAKAPDWRVHVFRPDDKIELSWPLAAFDKVEFSPPTGLKRIGVYAASVKTETTQADGLKLVTYKYATLDYRDEHVRVVNMAPAPQAMEILTHIYGLNRPGLPYHDTFFMPKSKSKRKMFDGLDLTPEGKKQWLITLAWSKKPCSQDDFTIPTGFKTVGGVRDVLISRKRATEFDADMTDLGLMRSPEH